jgi:hypothetical protein
MKKYIVAISTLVLVVGCTQETQNSISRSIQNWTGTNGVLKVWAGDKLVEQYIKIDKLSTAYGTYDKKPRPYRYGYGYHDKNLNGKVDEGEKKGYFEFSDYSVQYFFYEDN